MKGEIIRLSLELIIRLSLELLQGSSKQPDCTPCNLAVTGAFGRGILTKTLNQVMGQKKDKYQIKEASLQQSLFMTLVCPALLVCEKTQTANLRCSIWLLMPPYKMQKCLPIKTQ